MLGAHSSASLLDMGLCRLYTPSPQCSYARIRGVAHVEHEAATAREGRPGRGERGVELIIILDERPIPRRREEVTVDPLTIRPIMKGAEGRRLSSDDPRRPSVKGWRAWQNLSKNSTDRRVFGRLGVGP